MNKTVESGKTLLVDGPASVAVVSGRVEVFGAVLESTSRVVIREGKRLPFVVKEKASFDILLGDDASIEEVDGSTIPSSWDKAYEELLNFQEKSITALVLGTVDSGKTSFCTYLINKLTSEKLKVAILDGDLGQSDIGPPCTLAYAFVTRPITDLFSLEARNAFFVGLTSPSKVVDKVIKGLDLLKKEIFNENPDFIIVNSDGWIEDAEAVNYKVKLVEKLSPDVIFCIQRKGEMAPILNALEKFRKVIVDSPLSIRQRNREKRKSLRELGYIKYLKNAKVKSVPLNWLKIEEEFTGNDIEVVCKGGEGLLVALYDSNRRFLGIGILHKIYHERKIMKIYTPVSKDISIVAIGKVKLDKNLKEITCGIN